MTPPTVVNKKTDKYDIFIGRPSEYGNPFIVGKNGNRERVIHLFRKYFLQKPNLDELLITLEGKRLGCFCKPEACHGDVLVELFIERFCNER